MKHEKPAFTPSESSTTMKRGIRFVIAAIAVFLLLGPVISTVSAATYYVATTGNDTTGNGSFSLPWLTIGKAASVMVAGDTTYIRGGTYNVTSSITPANSGSAGGGYITFSAYQSETPTITGNSGSSNRVFALTSAHSYFRFIGLTIKNSNSGGGIGVTKDSVTAPYPHHIEIRNCTIQDYASSSCIKIWGGHDIIFAGCTFLHSKQGLELAVAVAATGELKGNDYNIQVIDCKSSTMTWDGYVSKEQHHYADPPYNTIIVWDCWCENIYFTGCVADHCNDDGYDFRGRYNTLEYCVSHDNVIASNYIDEHGFKFYALDIPVDPNKYHAEFIRCLSYNNAREGFKFSSILDNTTGGSANYVKKFRMINCTSANDDYGFSLVTNSIHPMNVEMKNNIISSKICAWEITGNPVIWAPPPGSGTVMPTSLPSYLTLNSNYNLLYADTNSYPITYIYGNLNLAGWQSTSGQDLNSISASPVFDANYHPMNLACINSGIDVGQPYAGSAPDMGFFESGTVTVNCPADYLTTGENWISIPVAASNDGAYSVFKDLGKWPNSVYHNLYRYNSPTAGFVEYPTYQSDALQFGKIVPGQSYKLMLNANVSALHVAGLELTKTQELTIPGTGTRYYYFGDPFNKSLYRSNCRIKNGGSEVSLNEAVSNGWVNNPEHFNPTNKTWESAGNILSPWHAYRLQALTAGELKLVMYYPRPGDLDNDGDVDYDDLGIMGDNWLVEDCNNIPVGNLNSDCTVDFNDYAILTGNWTGGI